MRPGRYFEVEDLLLVEHPDMEELILQWANNETVSLSRAFLCAILVTG